MLQLTENCRSGGDVWMMHHPINIFKIYIMVLCFYRCEKTSSGIKTTETL